MNVTVSLGSIRDNAKHRPATPHILNWELHYADGSKPRKFSFSCDSRPVIAGFRSQLDDARNAGLAFDPATGLPTGVGRPPARHQGETAATATPPGPGAARAGRHTAASPPPGTVKYANCRGVDLTASMRIQANPDVRDEGAAL